MAFLESYLRDPVEGWRAINDAVWPHLSEEERRDVARACDVLVGRVKECLVHLVRALTEGGYVFSADEGPFSEPPADTETRLDVLEELVRQAKYSGHTGKALSPLLRSWYREVGAVDFSGYHPQWPTPEPKKSALSGSRFYTDPFQFYPLEAVIDDLRERVADGPTYAMAFGSDAVHKAGESGGPKYQLHVIGTKVDPLCYNTARSETLVQYFRRSVSKWGGLPGFASYKNYPKKWIAELTRGLTPF